MNMIERLTPLSNILKTKILIRTKKLFSKLVIKNDSLMKNYHFLYLNALYYFVKSKLKSMRKNKSLSEISSKFIVNQCSLFIWYAM